MVFNSRTHEYGLPVDHHTASPTGRAGRQPPAGAEDRGDATAARPAARPAAPPRAPAEAAASPPVNDIIINTFVSMCVPTSITSNPSILYLGQAPQVALHQQRAGIAGRRRGGVCLVCPVLWRLPCLLRPCLLLLPRFPLSLRPSLCVCARVCAWYLYPSINLYTHAITHVCLHAGHA